MEKSTYKRKTNNPKMGWSDERRAKFSEICKKARANKTWFKKSDKAVSEAISNGKKEAQKFRNRSEGQKKRYSDQANIKKVVASNPIEKVDDRGYTFTFSHSLSRELSEWFNIFEKRFGIRPDFGHFCTSAVRALIKDHKAELSS